MFCDKCGTQLKDGAMFCQACGQRVTPQPAQPVQPEMPKQEWQAPQQEWPPVQQEWSDNTEKKRSGIRGLIVTVVFLFLIAGAIGALMYYFSKVDQKEAGKVAQEFMDATIRADAESLVALILPEDMVDEALDEACEKLDCDRDEVYEKLETQINQIYGMAGVEDTVFEIKVKRIENINRLDKLEDEVEENGYDNLDDFRDRMDELYDGYGFDADKITKVYAVELKIEGEEDEQKGTIVFISYKYKGKWYVAK